MPERRGAVEFQGAVGLEEVKVRAHLDRSIAGILDVERDRRTPRVQLDVTFAQDQAADRSCAPAGRLGRCVGVPEPRRPHPACRRNSLDPPSW